MTRRLSPEITARLWRFSHRAAVVTLLYFPAMGLYARSYLGRDQLCNAAYHGRLNEVRFLLNAGADPSRVGWDSHFTPLGEAVRGGQIESARLLLQNGADPNAPGDSGSTAIESGLHNWGVSQSLKEPVAALLREAGGR